MCNEITEAHSDLSILGSQRWSYHLNHWRVTLFVIVCR